MGITAEIGGNSGLEREHPFQEIAVGTQRDPQRLGVSGQVSGIRVDRRLLLVQSRGQVVHGAGHHGRGQCDRRGRVIDEQRQRLGETLSGTRGRVRRSPASQTGR